MANLGAALCAVSLVYLPTATPVAARDDWTETVVTELVDGPGCTGAACSLRGLLGRGTTVVELPAARLTLGTRRPLDIRGSVTLRGAGPDRSIIDGLEATRLFRLHPGAQLRVEGVALLQGGPAPVEIAQGATVELIDVFLSDGPRAPVADPSQGVAYCATNGDVLSQFIGVATISDPTALGLLPGRPF
jgi:hypothetical protein